jgi:ribosomal RNA-processing protein 7
MAPPSLIPAKVQDFTILPLTLPPQPSYQKPATHYLYLRPDAAQPGSEPNPDTSCSVFVANIPIISTEQNFRVLFKRLCGAIVSRVDFEGEQRRPGLVALSGEAIVQGTSVNVPIEVTRGKKRKRGGDEVVKKALEEMELPRIWGGDVWRSGSCATVCFVDQASRDLVLRECRKVAKKGGAVEWRADSEDELGEKRRLSCIHIFISILLTENNRLSYPPHPNLPLPIISSTKSKHLPYTFHQTRSS